MYDYIMHIDWLAGAGDCCSICRFGSWCRIYRSVRRRNHLRTGHRFARQIIQAKEVSLNRGSFFLSFINFAKLTMGIMRRVMLAQLVEQQNKNCGSRVRAPYVTFSF